MKFSYEEKVRQIIEVIKSIFKTQRHLHHTSKV